MGYDIFKVLCCKTLANEKYPPQPSQNVILFLGGWGEGWGGFSDTKVVSHRLGLSAA